MIHNIDFSSAKVSSESREKYAKIKHRSKQMYWWILMWEDNRGWTFSLEEEDCGHLARSDGLKLNALMMDLFLTNTQTFTSQGINWWTGVLWITCGLLWCFYQLFGLSFWRHPFTAEDPLVSKWWNAIFLHTSSDEETNSSTS